MSSSLKLLQEIQNEIQRAKNIQNGKSKEATKQQLSDQNTNIVSDFKPKEQERPKSKTRQPIEQELNPTLLTLPYSKQTHKEIVIVKPRQYSHHDYESSESENRDPNKYSPHFPLTQHLQNDEQEELKQSSTQNIPLMMLNRSQDNIFTYNIAENARSVNMHPQHINATGGPKHHEQKTIIENQQQQRGEKSEILYAQIDSGIRALQEDLGRECDDIVSKIEQIMRTELLTFEKIKSIQTIGTTSDYDINYQD